MKLVNLSNEQIAKIEADPNYKHLKRKRNAMGVTLCIITFVIYYGWIGLIAFNKDFLSQPLGSGVTTIAIPIGIGVIICMVLLTAIYVLNANKSYDALIKKIEKDAL